MFTFFFSFAQTDIASFISSHFFLLLFIFHSQDVHSAALSSFNICVFAEHTVGVVFLWRDLKGKFKPNKNCTKLKLLHLINISKKHLNAAYQTNIKIIRTLPRNLLSSRVSIFAKAFSSNFFGDLLFSVFFQLSHGIHAKKQARILNRNEKKFHQGYLKHGFFSLTQYRWLYVR